MELVDSHAHLFLKEFDEDLAQVIERAKSAGVIKIYLPNIDSSTLDNLLDVSNRYPGYLFPMVGLHPTSVKDNYLEELKLVDEQLQSVSDYIAIGEVGLDLYWDKTYITQQVEAFEYQIRLALKHNLPLIIHCRDAFDEMYEVMLPLRNSGLKGVFHSFTGSLNDAKRFLEFPGFKLGINGVVTFKNSVLPETLREVPLSRLVIETDAPYLAPVPYRGKRNESAYLVNIVRALAGIFQVTEEEIATVTTENACEIFGNSRTEADRIKFY